jgi:hypothetical protein
LVPLPAPTCLRTPQLHQDSSQSQEGTAERSGAVHSALTSVSCLHLFRTQLALGGRTLSSQNHIQLFDLKQCRERHTDKQTERLVCTNYHRCSAQQRTQWHRRRTPRSGEPALLRPAYRVTPNTCHSRSACCSACKLCWHVWCAARDITSKCVSIDGCALHVYFYLF